MGFDFVITAVVEILSQKFIGQPFPPAHSQITLHITIKGDNGDADHEAAKIDDDKEIGQILIFLHQGIGEVVGDITEGDIDSRHGKRQDQNGGKQRPGLPAASDVAAEQNEYSRRNN